MCLGWGAVSCLLGRGIQVTAGDQMQGLGYARQVHYCLATPPSCPALAMFSCFSRGSRTGLPTCYQPSIDCVEIDVPCAGAWADPVHLELTGRCGTSQVHWLPRDAGNMIRLTGNVVMGLILILSPKGFETPENKETFQVRLLAPKAKR